MTEALQEILANNKNNFVIDKVFNIKYLHILNDKNGIDITHILKSCIESNIYFLKYNSCHYQKIIHLNKDGKDFYFMRVLWSEYGVLREHNEIRKYKIIESM